MNNLKSTTSRLQLIVNIIFLSGITFLMYAHFTATRKVVYVDSAKLLSGYEGMINARKQFQQKAIDSM